jgi:hypothetical protein
MRSLLFVAMVVTMLASMPGFAAVVASEGFDSGTPGEKLTDLGYIGWSYGPAGASNNLIIASRDLGSGVTMCAQTDNYPGGYITKGINNTLTGNETQLYEKITIDTRGFGEGSGYQWGAGAFMLAGDDGNPTKGPLFGLTLNGPQSTKTFEMWTSGGFDIYGNTVGNGVYELALNINMNLSNLAASTGSLIYLQLDGGDGLWHSAGANLTNIALGYTAATVPSAQTRMGMYAYGYMDWFDNLELGTGSVPEPCTMALLALGGLTMLRKRSA